MFWFHCATAHACCSLCHRLRTTHGEVPGKSNTMASRERSCREYTKNQAVRCYTWYVWPHRDVSRSALKNTCSTSSPHCRSFKEELVVWSMFPLIMAVMQNIVNFGRPPCSSEGQLQAQSWGWELSWRVSERVKTLHTKLALPRSGSRLKIGSSLSDMCVRI